MLLRPSTKAFIPLQKFYFQYKNIFPSKKNKMI